MCDFFEDGFDDNYDEGESIDEDSFENEYNTDTEMDYPFDGDSGLDGEPDDAESKGEEFTAKDAFFAGSFAGWAYEEGLRERKRKKQKRFIDDDDSA